VQEEENRLMAASLNVYIIAGSPIFTRVNLGFVKWFGVSSDDSPVFLLLQ
jgi:hypothetical protein